MKKIKYVSKCCKKEVKLIYSEDFFGDDITKKDYIGTCSFECPKCGKPCDIIKKRGKRGKTS